MSNKREGKTGQRSGDGCKEKQRLTGQDEEQKADQNGIAEVEHVAGEARQRHLAEPVDEGVEEDVEGAGAGGEESAPLPVVVLGAEQEVDHEDGDGGASDDHEPVADEEKAEHVVHLAEPDAFHDELELDVDGQERQHADDEHRRRRSEVARRWRNLSRDLVGSDRGVDGLFRASVGVTRSKGGCTLWRCDARWSKRGKGRGSLGHRIKRSRYAQPV